MAFAYGLSPGEFLSLRFLVGSALLGLWLSIREPSTFRLPARTIAYCAALGIFGYALFSSFFFQALKGLSGSLTVLLLYTYPVMVSVGARVFLAQRLGRLAVVALPIVSLGLYLLMATEFRVYAPMALLFGFLAAVFYSVYILCSSYFLEKVPPLASTFYIMLAAGCALAALHLRPHTFELLPAALPVVIGTALIGTLAAMSLFLAGLQKLSGAEVSVLSTAEPITGVFLAGIFLGETLSTVQWLGAALIFAGMILVGMSKRKELSTEGMV